MNFVVIILLLVILVLEALNYRANALLFFTLRKEAKNMKEQLDALRAEVTREADLIKAAKVAFKGLADQISANANNPEGLKELVDSLRAQDDDFAAAIAANTPASATPTPAPTPTEPPATPTV